MLLDGNMVLGWLRETDERRLQELWSMADAVRRENVGDAVHLRGLIEISNFCIRQCAYCGISTGAHRLKRYRMSAAEIMSCVQQARSFGYGSVVFQSGEDPGITLQWLADIIRRIKGETGLAVTLGLGERSAEDFSAWRAAGADRYLLKFETSNKSLYSKVHPSLEGKSSDRVAMLKLLRSLGYEIGSGVMVGLPGQTFHDLASDIQLFQELDLDMIGVGPFIPHPDTPLGKAHSGAPAPNPEQVPNTDVMTYKVIALTRLLCPRANIPSTTALATVNQDKGTELGLQRGANVVMPNLTPPIYRVMYDIYPREARKTIVAEEFDSALKRKLAALGRTPGTGRGDSMPRNAPRIPCIRKEIP